uniref:Transmembrane p24 trafficking protein 1b n=1 Tax=Cyprinus carpio TaxID=7962 RepID=A0A8C1WF74_CYPCA
MDDARRICASLLGCVALFVGAANAFSPIDSEFTFQLPAASKECFYQSAVHNSSIEIEYQVIAGAGMDVDFSIVSPQGIHLVSEFRRSDGVHICTCAIRPNTMVLSYNTVLLLPHEVF